MDTPSAQRAIDEGDPEKLTEPQSFDEVAFQKDIQEILLNSRISRYSERHILPNGEAMMASPREKVKIPPRLVAIYKTQPNQTIEALIQLVASAEYEVAEKAVIQFFALDVSSGPDHEKRFSPPAYITKDTIDSPHPTVPMSCRELEVRRLRNYVKLQERRRLKRERAAKGS